MPSEQPKPKYTKAMPPIKLIKIPDNRANNNSTAQEHEWQKQKYPKRSLPLSH